MLTGIEPVSAERQSTVLTVERKHLIFRTLQTALFSLLKAAPLGNGCEVWSSEAHACRLSTCLSSNAISKRTAAEDRIRTDFGGTSTRILPTLSCCRSCNPCSLTYHANKVHAGLTDSLSVPIGAATFRRFAHEEHWVMPPPYSLNLP